MATTEMRMVQWAMGVSLLEHRRNYEILEEAKVEPIRFIHEFSRVMQPLHCDVIVDKQ